ARTRANPGRSEEAIRRGKRRSGAIEGILVDVTEILTPQAVAFVTDLQRRFGPRRDELLAHRAQRRAEIARTGRLDFLPETKEIREADWRVPPPPVDLTDRRVEITGP